MEKKLKFLAKSAVIFSESTKLPRKLNLLFHSLLDIIMTLLIKEPIYEKPPSQVNLKIASRNIMSKAKTSYPDVLYFFQEQLFEVCLEFNIDSTQGDKRVRMHFLLSNPVKSQTKMRFPMLFLTSKDPKNFFRSLCTS